MTEYLFIIANDKSLRIRKLSLKTRSKKEAQEKIAKRCGTTTNNIIIMQGGK